MVTRLCWVAVLSWLFASAARANRPKGAYSTSGFYFDNGMDQTMVEVMTLEEQELLREEMLALLGLTYAPSKGNIHGIDLRTLGNKTRSHFMRDVYDSLRAREGEGADSGGELSEEPDPASELLGNPFVFSPEEVRAVEESDVIVGFANRGRQQDMRYTQLFWFDTSELPSPQDEEVIRAELRLYKGAPTDGSNDDDLVVRLYQLVPGSTGEENRLDTLALKGSDRGWVRLDLTKALRDWQLDYKMNQGLMVQVWRQDGSEQLRPSQVGLSGDRVGDPEHEAFMVGYFVGRHDNPLNRRNLRLRRDVGNEGRARRAAKSGGGGGRRKKHYSDIHRDFAYGGDSSSSGSNNPYRDFYGGRFRNRHCQRRGFRVSFKDLGWEDWIIAPDDYEAFYCHGECNFPLNTHMNATNHAIVQTLVHLMNPHKFPKPSCTATKLSAIQVLYFDESSNVILKKYKNMVVKSCGCH